MVQVEAASQVNDLFPNMRDNVATDTTNTEDVDAGHPGQPFTVAEHEDEWVDWVDWAAVETQTAGAGASGA